MKVRKIKLSLLLLLSSLSIVQNSFCQRDIESTPLVKFLQQNTDTTIIFFYTSPWLFSIDQLIVSKVENRVLYFTYANPYKRYSLMYNLPKGEIAKKLRQEEQLFDKTKPDTNRYFLPKDIKPGLGALTWGRIAKLDPWKLKDDNDSSVRNEKCKDYESDGATLFLLLITQGEIRQLSYYNPAFFEDCIPGNINRQKIIKIEKIFKSVYDQE